jgi:hypothetical protein
MGDEAVSVTVRPVGGTSAYTEADHTPFRSVSEDNPGFAREGGGPSDAWSDLIDELLRIRTLQDGWDGEGAEAPHPALVDGAITLAQDLQARGEPPADRVIASVNGTVYFEWHTPLGYREIEVVSPLDAESRWVPKGSNETVVVGLTRRP